MLVEITGYCRCIASHQAERITGQAVDPVHIDFDGTSGECCPQLLAFAVLQVQKGLGCSQRIHAQFVAPIDEEHHPPAF